MRNRIVFSLRLLVIFFVFSACAGVDKSSKTEYKSQYTIDSIWDLTSQKDTAFQNLINNYKKELDDEMNMVISITDEAMIADRPESKLSNLIADAMLEIGREYCKEHKLTHSVDFSVMNQGGIRTALPKGEITTSRVYEMLPFKNKLVIVGMNGKEVQKLLDQLASFGGEGISGLKMGIKNEKAVEVEIGGESINPEKIYHIVSIDYLVNGGGGITAFQNRETFRHLHKKLRSEIIRYMTRKYKNGEHLSSKLDGRVYHVE